MSKTLSDDPIGTIYGEHPNERASEPYVFSSGLTKREYFAAQAIAGLSTDDSLSPEEVAGLAVSIADETIMELNDRDHA